MSVRSLAYFKLFPYCGVFGTVLLIRDTLFPLRYLPKVRIIRLPIYIRGKRGIIKANNLNTGVSLTMDIINSNGNTEKLSIGKNMKVNDYFHVGGAKEISIVDHTLIASKVFISDDHHDIYKDGQPSDHFETPIDRIPKAKIIKMRRNVWIGKNVCVFPGVTIGDGAIVKAMSSVAKDIPVNTIAMVSPAKVIKTYDVLEKKWKSI